MTLTAPPTDPAARPPMTAEEIFRAYGPRVYHLARRLLGNEADAEDVAQDVFVQVLRKLPTFRGEAALPTWLYRVTVNAALACRRKRAVRTRHLARNPLDDFLSDGRHAAPVRRWPDPEEQAVAHETHDLVETGIARLPEGCRDVLVLADVEQLPSAEVGAVLGLSAPAVKGRLHRARLLLRRWLARMALA